MTTLIDTDLGDGVSVPHSYCLNSEIESTRSVGPFTHLRPGALGRGRQGRRLRRDQELRHRRGGEGAHLSYVGDADLGEGTNIGAGTITANYDGVQKHRTVIGRGVRTGIHTSLVAPVSVGDGAYTGAGSVITQDVPPGALGIARPRQENVDDYAERPRPRRSKDGKVHVRKGRRNERRSADRAARGGPQTRPAEATTRASPARTTSG